MQFAIQENVSEIECENKEYIVTAYNTLLVYLYLSITPIFSLPGAIITKALTI